MNNTENDPFEDWPPANQDSGKNWSKAKLKILKLLWPMDWITGDAIFQSIEQTYYDRRIRELRESGWQIETHSSGKMYRLASHEKLPGEERTYPSAKIKREVRERDSNTCQICGEKDENIQFDHKIPFERHGQTTTENLQILCRTCNVEKRGACKNCTLTSCKQCPYAFPELYENRITISFPPETAKLLSDLSLKLRISKAHAVLDIITEYFSKKSNS